MLSGAIVGGSMKAALREYPFILSVCHSVCQCVIQLPFPCPVVSYLHVPCPVSTTCSIVLNTALSSCLSTPSPFQYFCPSTFVYCPPVSSCPPAVLSSRPIILSTCVSSSRPVIMSALLSYRPPVTLSHHPIQPFCPLALLSCPAAFLSSCPLVLPSSCPPAVSSARHHAVSCRAADTRDSCHRSTPPRPLSW